MEITFQVQALEALAHETRLGIVRLLVPAGAHGLSAGTIAARLAVPANSLSFHLTRLAHAGLVRGRRQGRNLYYALAYEQLSALIAFLAEDCCADAPKGCMPGCPSVPAAFSEKVNRVKA